MCGIHGILTTRRRINTADDFMKDAFIAGSLRGNDASGIASIDTFKGVALVHKLPVPGFMFGTNGYANSLMVRACNTNMLTIGHTRAGTSGDMGMSSAHPFVIEDEEQTRMIVGVHNGTLTSWHNKPAAKGCTVDSEWAFTHIFNKGKEAFKDFFGAYAYVWWDSDNPKMLNMARNDQRPMCVAILQDEGLAFASEPGMLAWLLERRGIKVEGKIKFLKENFHYQFPVNDPSKYTKETLRLPPPIQTRQVSGATTTSYSHFEKVDAFLKSIMGKEVSEGAKAVLVKSSLRKAEIDNADALKLRGKEGIFQPIWEDDETGVILGDFIAESGESYTAEIRGQLDIKWDLKTTWHTRVVGVTDIDNISKEITVICAKPEVRKALALVN
jgi:glucosamine 6-phosphate synthetase-like amidotransferase/phosphosugar isomerase protein